MEARVRVVGFLSNRRDVQLKSNYCNENLQFTISLRVYSDIDILAGSTVAALGVSLSLQHSKLGVRQNRADMKKLLPISVTVTTLLLR